MLAPAEIAQEPLHVLDLGAAPAVDRLVVVADHEHVAVVAGEHAHEGVLDGVGVLEFVDQELAEAVAVVRQQRRVVAQQLVRAQQQLGEIDQAGAVAALLVGRVQLRIVCRRSDRRSAWMCCGRRPSSFCALIHHAIWRGGKRAVVEFQLLHARA